MSGLVSRAPVGSKWGLGNSSAAERDSREGVYSSVPSADLEADSVGVPQPRQKRGGKLRSPRKKGRMAQQDNSLRGIGRAATAVDATEEQTGFFHPEAHTEDGEYYSSHSQGQNRGLYAGGTGGEGHSPSTASSARGFAAAGAPIGRSVTPEVQGGGGVWGQYSPPLQHQQQQYGEYHNKGGNYPPQQQYYNNNYYSGSTPLPPYSNSNPSLNATATLAGLPPPNAPHLTSNLSRPSNSSLHSQTSSHRRSFPPGAGIALIPTDDSPYKRFSGLGGGSATALGIDGQIDVNMLDEDDPDDGLATPPPPGGHHRGHGILTGLRGGRSNNNSGMLAGTGAVGAAGAVAGAGVAGDAASGGLLLGGVNPIAELGESTHGVGTGGGGGVGNIVAAGIVEKESDWLASQKHSKKKTRKIAILILVILVLVIAGGVAAGVLLSKKKSSSKSSNDNSSSRDSSNSDSNSNSDDGGTKTPISSTDDSEWKSYLNNPALRKVFHGIDYTPLNALYPECLGNPPTQAQINIDLAIMSQLTTRIRLYGTDCDQAEMVLKGIKTTGVNMKIWLGVWLDGNATTNARSLTHMYDILAKYPTSMFEGIAVGNEVLFRQELTELTLSTVLKEVKTNLTQKGIDLPVGTSDLGSNWSATLASAVDVLMANVHPFFGGVEAAEASKWTMTFYEENNLPKAKAAGIRGMISEVGWPTDGGKLKGSVAGVDELNTFLNDWVCQRMKDETEYFWFSAFDEPWKTKYNEAGKEWEDKWGLLDAKRRVKPGVKIPSCD